MLVLVSVLVAEVEKVVVETVEIVGKVEKEEIEEASRKQ